MHIMQPTYLLYCSTSILLVVQFAIFFYDVRRLARRALSSSPSLSPHSPILAPTMMELISDLIGRFGIESVLPYVVVAILAIFGHFFVNHLDRRNLERQAAEVVEEEEEEDPDPPRNFTAGQLRSFDGTVDEKTRDVKPTYMSVGGVVFNVSKGRDFYGPGGPYEMFAGRECGVALAKMSFDEAHVDDLAGVAELNFGERNELDGWVEKFQHYRCYPIMGRLVPDDKIPSRDRLWTKEDLAKNDGSGEAPEGYATAPIYVGAAGKVFDCSFGGVTFYGQGCTYNRFAGKDASRALAKMSFDPQDVENPDISTLTDKETKVLHDWVKTFEVRKQYPVVGKI